jgi:hypothetical protein
VRPLLERRQGFQQSLAASGEAALVVLEDGHARSVGTGRVQCQAPSGAERSLIVSCRAAPDWE